VRVVDVPGGRRAEWEGRVWKSVCIVGDIVYIEENLGNNYGEGKGPRLEKRL
jgi:hypothetical protein